jgi:hypothetical protein
MILEKIKNEILSWPGSTIMIFASNVKAPGEFYAVNTMVYFSQLIQIVRGRNSILNGQRNVLNKSHGPRSK